MILVDANLLAYAHVGSFAQPERARAWLDGKLNGTAAVGLPWPSLLAFVRLVTNPRVFERPEPMGEAWRQVLAWLACETVWVPRPPGSTCSPTHRIWALHLGRGWRPPNGQVRIGAAGNR